MKYITLFFLLFNSLYCFAQISIYKGTVGKSSIELTMHSFSDNSVNAICLYGKLNQSIQLNGKLKNDTLILIEKDKNKEVLTKLIFTKIYNTDKRLYGIWINEKHKKPIQIDKLYEFQSYDTTSFKDLELQQTNTTKQHYFKLLLSKESKKAIKVVGVRIYDRKTNHTFQEMKLEGNFRGLFNITVGDYNFDGLEDFSVLEQNYTGSNTSRFYILRMPNSEQYFVSEITGISLNFDKKLKLVFEHNQCCGGNKHTNTTYKIVNNKMVLVERKCIEYNKKKKDFIKVTCE